MYLYLYFIINVINIFVLAIISEVFDQFA